MRKVVVISGVPIDDLDVEGALREIDAMVAAGRAKAGVHTVALVDANAIMTVADDPGWQEALKAADLIAADGWPLAWGARLLGAQPTTQWAGAGLLPRIIHQAESVGHALFFLMANQEAAERAAFFLRACYPRLIIVGAQGIEGAGADGSAAALDAVHAARPDILFVALGSPEQEKWIATHARRAAVPVIMGVGDAIERMVGTERSIPSWLNVPGLSAPYQLLGEASHRVRQRATDLAGLAEFAIKNARKMRRAQPQLILPSCPAVLMGKTAVLSVRGRLDSYRQNEFTQLATAALLASHHVVVNLAQVTFLDSSALGALVSLARRARDTGGELWLAAVPAPIARVLSLTRLDRFMKLCPDVETVLGWQRGAEARAAPGTPVGDSCPVLAMPRRLDSTSAPEVMVRCRASLAHNPRLVIDLSSTEFLASAGLAALGQLGRYAKAAGGELRVVGPSPDIMRTIRMVNLDLAMHFYPSVRAAAGTGV